MSGDVEWNIKECAVYKNDLKIVLVLGCLVGKTYERLHHFQQCFVPRVSGPNMHQRVKLYIKSDQGSNMITQCILSCLGPASRTPRSPQHPPPRCLWWRRQHSWRRSQPKDKCQYSNPYHQASRSNLHHVNVVQFLALLGDALGPEAISISALAIARSVVTVSNFPVLAHCTESFLPETNATSLLL